MGEATVPSVVNERVKAELSPKRNLIFALYLLVQRDLTEHIPYFILEKNAKSIRTGQFGAYCLFIDIVGFTKLTTNLMAQGTLGAEQLSDTLNKLFGPLVDHVYQRDGFIPYFAGDAFLAFFEAENTSTNLEHCLDLAAGIQDYFSKTEDPDIADIEIKIGLSYGQVDWGICGAEEGKKTYYFRGEAIERATEAQKKSAGGEVVLAADLMPAKAAWIQVLEDPSYIKLDNYPLAQKKSTAPKKQNGKNKYAASIAEFIPQQIIDYQLKGEFREVVSVFISFKGVDNHASADPFFAGVRALTESFSGYFKEIDFSDKGGVIVILFGAPVTFENNVERALEFILAFREEINIGSYDPSLKFKAGIANGLCFTGMLGGTHKKQYVALGTHVNLAARLMSYSKWGQISVARGVQQEDGFVFQRKGKVHYKGIEKAINTYTLEVKSNVESQFKGHFIGREEEEELILRFLKKNTLKKSNPAFIKIYGEAGIGKSRLIHEIEKQLVQHKKVRWHTCQADQILKKPFNPIIYFLKDYFDQNPKHTHAENKQHFEAKLDYFIEEFETEGDEGNAQQLSRIRPVFNALLGFDTKDTLWEELDARAKFNAIIKSVVYIFKTISRKEKLIVEFEDLHWFDESTMAFLKKLIEEVDDSPIAIVCTSRYRDDGTKPAMIANEFLEDEGFALLEVDLNQLSKDAIHQYSEKKLKGKVSQRFSKFLSRTTNGNPFYLEQIIEYLVESDLIHQEDEAWHIKDEEISISSSINSILMARVDRLSEQVKETVKTAAVIGREFEIPVLNEVMKTNVALKPTKLSPHPLQEQIKAAEKGQIWSAINELKYIFKHSLLREAVYNMQLKSNLRNLHQSIGEAIEQLYKNNLSERYADLAFHFEEAEKHTKAIFYMKKAADYARKNFQNKRALMYYGKLKAYVDPIREPEEYAKILLRESEILELVGRWNESLVLLREANIYAEKTKNQILLGRTKNQLGKLLVLQGNYDEAKFILETAMKIFKDFNDEIGLFKAYGNLGDLFFRKADYDDARAYFEKSISLAKDFKDTFTVTQIVSNLGLTYMNQSLYDEAIECQVEQLALCEQRGDRNGMAILNTNIGIVYSEINDHEKALPYFEKGYELSHELGNKQMEAIAIGCLGNIYQQRGNYAKALELYTIDLKLCKELGDKRGIAIVNGLLGELLIATGGFTEAKGYLADQLHYSQELQYQKGITKAYISLGQVHFFEEDYQNAITAFSQCIEIAESIKYFPSLEEASLWKIEVYIAQNDLEKAKRTLRDIQTHEELEDLEWVLLLQARVQILENNSQPAIAELEKLIASSKDVQLLAEAHVELSIIKPATKAQAIKEVKALYESTPHYQIKLRLDALLD